MITATRTTTSARYRGKQYQFYLSSY